MSLQKQLVHLNMSGGLQKKDDSFLVIPSKLAVADDVEFDDLSTVKTRGAQASVSLASVSVLEAVASAKRAFANGSEAVIECASGDYKVTPSGVVQVIPVESSGNGGARVFSRASMTTRRDGSMLTKASVPGAGYPLFANNIDTAVIGDVQFSAWETKDPSTGLNTIRYQFTDIPSQKVTISGMLNTLATKVRVQPRVLAVGTKFILYFGIFTAAAVTYEVRRIVWNSSGSVANAETVVITSSAAAAAVESAENYAVLFDVAVSFDGLSLGLVIRDVDAPRTLRFRGLSLTDYSTITQAANVAPSAVPTSLTAVVSKNGATYRLHAFFSVATTTARAINMNQGTGATSAETVVGTGAAGSVTARLAGTQTTDGGSITLAWDSRTATLEQSTLRLSTFSDTYGTLGECPAFSPWFVAGRIAVFDSRMYLPMMFCGSELLPESTNFVVDLTSALRNIGTPTNSQPPHVVARIDYGESPMFLSQFRAHRRVASCAATSSGLLFSYPKFETDLVFAGSTNDTSVCAATATLDFGSQLGDAEINGLTFLAGACPLVYDGQSVVEEGFHHAPYNALAVAAAAAGTYGPFPLGDVTVCFTLGWQDDRGNWHESAPSNERVVTFAGANTYLTPTLVLPPTQKRGTVLRIYRTKASSTDTSMYLSQTSAGAFIDTDTTLGESEQLYTAGNVLPNTPAPSCRHVSVFQKRLVLSGCGDGSRVHWSKQTTPGYGVEFSAGDPTHQTSVPSDKGRVVATEEMDDRLVVLCENGVGIISGTGPAPTGLAGQYSDFSSIITETGCSWDSPKSVTRGPEGVWFRSPFGIRLVSRSGSLARNQDGKQAGAEVDSLVSGTVVAVAGDTRQQVRFYQSSGTCLVWDYQWQQWTRFTGMANVDAVYADDRFYHLSNYSTSSPLLRYTTSRAGYEDVTSEGVPGAVFTATVETPWLSFAGIQGFQRVYRLMLLGKDAGTPGETHAITLSVYKDFADGAPVETASVLAATTSNGQIQIQHHFATQKCESMKLRLTFGADPAGGEAALRLTDLTLQVGVKSGYNKLPSSQRF